MQRNINIKDLDKAEVLACLFNHAKFRGMQLLDEEYQVKADKIIMTVTQAKEIIAMNNNLHFDYVWAKAIKTNLSGDEIDPGIYDREHGQGAAEAAIQTIRNKKNKPPVFVVFQPKNDGANSKDSNNNFGGFRPGFLSGNK